MDTDADLAESLHLFLTTTPPLLRVGATIIRGAAFFGVVAVSYNKHYMGLAVLAMFAGLCGVSALFVLNPELVFETGYAHA